MGVKFIMYFYAISCLSLLVFNILYILFAKKRRKNGSAKSKEWTGILTKQIAYVQKYRAISGEHAVLMQKKLKNVNELVAYSDAMRPLLGKEGTRAYLDACHDVFRQLAETYAGNPPMERAFFAYLISKYHPRRNQEKDLIAEQLVKFLQDSTVFCRENVLQAMSAMGSSKCIVSALTIFHENGWYHHPNLLSDGLSSFVGDRAMLAKLLWKTCRDWEDYLQVSIVRFTANVTNELQEPFLEALMNDETSEEIKYALIRYFIKRPYAKAAPYLRKLVAEEDHGGPAIVACAALAEYPGEETMEVLWKAMKSPNWSVRKNAASSLVKLGSTAEDFNNLHREDGDRNTAEMLAYVERLQKGGQNR